MEACAVEVSVVVAARNEEDVLGRCLWAIRQQNFVRPYEVLVVDNASDDRTAEVAEAFGCRVVREPQLGQVGAKRRGVAAARGQIVAVLDADCAPAPGWLTALYHALADRGFVAVTACYRFEPDLPWWGRAYVTSVQRGLVGAYRALLPDFPFVLGGNVAFKREEYERVGGYSEDGGIAETELGLARRLRRVGRIAYVPDMEVTSTTRRFQNGWIAFFVDYKLGMYLLPYYQSRLIAWRAMWQDRRSRSGPGEAT